MMIPSTWTIAKFSWEQKIQSLADANEDKQVYNHVGLAVGDPKSPILMEYRNTLRTAKTFCIIGWNSSSEFWGCSNTQNRALAAAMKTRMAHRVTIKFPICTERADRSPNGRALLRLVLCLDLSDGTDARKQAIWRKYHHNLKYSGNSFSIGLFQLNHPKVARNASC